MCKMKYSFHQMSFAIFFLLISAMQPIIKKKKKTLLFSHLKLFSLKDFPAKTGTEKKIQLEFCLLRHKAQGRTLISIKNVRTRVMYMSQLVEQLIKANMH